MLAQISYIVSSPSLGNYLTNIRYQIFGFLGSHFAQFSSVILVHRYFGFFFFFNKESYSALICIPALKKKNKEYCSHVTDGRSKAERGLVIYPVPYGGFCFQRLLFSMSYDRGETRNEDPGVLGDSLELCLYSIVTLFFKFL